MNLLSRVRRSLARLEERLPDLTVSVEVSPFTWRFEADSGRIDEGYWAGRRWQASLTLGPVSVGVSLELPKREDEDDYHA